MSTMNGMRPQTPDPPRKENLWTRIGTLGQTLTAVIGLVAALIPILAKTGLPGEAGPPPGPTVVTTTTHPPTQALTSTPPKQKTTPTRPKRTPTTAPTQPTREPTTAPTRPTEAPTTTEKPDPITLTVSDQLTQGVEEEIIAITLDDVLVARLHATRTDPVVSKRVTATRPGIYSYALSAVIRWYDDIGTEQITRATGQGTVPIDDGTRLDVYLNEDNATLSLRPATAQ